MNSNDIDYSIKIANFKTITETNDDEIAIKYLENADWDETRASENYFNDISSNINRVNTNTNTNSGNNIRQNEDPFAEFNEPLVSNNNNRNNRGFIGGIFDTMRNMMMGPGLVDRMFSSHFDNNNIYNSQNQNNQNIKRDRNISTTKSDTSNELLDFLPYHTKNLNDFYSAIKKKIGILILYNSKDVDVVHHSIEKLYDNPDIISILENQFVSFCLEANTKEAKEILNKTKSSLPCIFLMFNPLNLPKNDSNIIIDKLQGLDKLDELTIAIYKSLTNKENIEQNNRVNKNDEMYGYDYLEGEEDIDNHAKIIKKQQEEMRKLERQEEEIKLKQKQEEEMKIKKEREEREKIEKLKAEEKKKEVAKKIKKDILPVEPLSTDPQSTLIMFRFPDGESRAERRFAKFDRIKDLYNYIESLDNVNFNQEGKFELIQTFPFNLFNDFDKTLEDERLFPNAILQIREKEA